MRLVGPVQRVLAACRVAARALVGADGLAGSVAPTAAAAADVLLPLAGHPDSGVRARPRPHRHRPPRATAPSGLLVGTGTGCGGSCRSVWHQRDRQLDLPHPEVPSLVWFAREAWPSPATGHRPPATGTMVEGLLPASARVEL
ncbi:hypothetical protein [Parafrankia sp. FMc2]|uniref:hypothetical protein n=1 Tax=Parafrankia sp. FMc2 TaxID=3233196 RepID=UPI0034D79865